MNFYTRLICYHSLVIWKYYFTELCRSSKCWIISLVNIKKKITFVNITANLIRKVFKYWEAVMLKVAVWVSQNSNFYSKAQTLSWRQTLLVVFLEVVLLKYLPDIQNWIYLSVILPSNSFSWKKLLVQLLHNKQLHEYFSLRWLSYFHVWKCFMYTFSLPHEILMTHVLCHPNNL